MERSVNLTRIYIFLLAVTSETFAFIPRICATNATTSLGICCPVPPGFVEPCGGPARGTCVEIPASRIGFSPAPEILMNDDRIDWPRRFFKYECSCEGNYMGYMCHECRFGYRGNHCMERYTRIRKDVRTLTSAEKLNFQTVVSQSKHVLSDYVALGNVYDIDPITSPTFVNLSVQDWIAYIHAYAARNTITNGSSTDCSVLGQDGFPAFDTVHRGPAFPSWHRLMLLVHERELQKISGQDDFTIPYYNWTSGPEAYQYVCDNDLMGAPNYSDPLGRLHRQSVFYNWYAVCQETDEANGCRVCNASQRGRPLRRTPGGTDHSVAPPTSEDEEYALNRPLYDSPPYDQTASGELSFRNVMEGFALRNSSAFVLHNLAHFFHKGTLDHVPTSANDPLFLLLHAFVDKHLEIWLRKNAIPITQMPERGAPLGHNREEPLVGFFPRHINSWYVTSSRVFGYDFDDMIMENDKDAGLQHSEWIITTVLGAVIVILLVLVIILSVKLRSAKHPEKRYSAVTSQTTDSHASPDEKSKLLL